MPTLRPEFRTDIERMLVYHSWAREKYLDLFGRLPWRVLTQKRGSTFESIRNVHLHVLAVYTGWLVSYFGERRLKPWLMDVSERTFLRQCDEYASVSGLREFNRNVDTSAQNVARRLSVRDFERKKTVGRRNGVTYRFTPREVFWHMIEEDFLHHGEILCMLWQADIQPPYTGVWWFEYDHNPSRHRDLPYADPKVPRPPPGGYVSQSSKRAKK